MDNSSDEPPSAPHRYHGWVMLDRSIRLDGYPEEAHFHATTACAMSCEGEIVRVSFSAVPPPVASRLFVSWTRSGEADDRDRRPSFLFMAAHGSSILLRLSRTRHDRGLFVYTARSTGPPLLRLLPGLNRMSDTYDFYELHWLFDTFSRDYVGLLCDGDGGFVVAELMTARHCQSDYYATPVKAGLCVFRSGSRDNNWKAMRLWVHHNKGQGNRELSLLMVWWSTHEVVAFRDSLCYVDYSRGILLVDVLSQSPKLHYIGLPTKIPICDLGNYNPDSTNFSEQSRSLCVTDGGRTMKFVEVAPCPGATAASALFTINVWRLRREGKSMIWETECGMEDAILWAQPSYGDLPRVVPIFPRVSLKESNLIYFFVVNNKLQIDDEDETWVIAVDMRKKTLRSSFRYTNDSGSLATNRAFIPCEFSKYLHVPKKSETSKPSI